MAGTVCFPIHWSSCVCGRAVWPVTVASLGWWYSRFFYAKKHKVSWTGLGDGLCVVAPIGLLCGRLANFINGELYGRVANGVAWAVKFPTALIDGKAPESLRLGEAINAAAQADPGFAKVVDSVPSDALEGERMGYLYQQLISTSRDSEPIRDAISPLLEARHPSQLYEGFLEGGLLFAILWVVRVKFPNAPNGLLTGLFFGLYATFRIFAEQFREPDAAWVIEGMLTKGQFLSLFMYLFAAAFLVYAWKGKGGTVRS